MKKCVALLLAIAAGFAAGCGKKEDPRERPGFVDTSDPSKVLGTMDTPKAKSSTALGGAGPGAPGAMKGPPGPPGSPMKK